jgi:hypothetical protein
MNHWKHKISKKRLTDDDRAVVQAYMPQYVRRALEKYVTAFNSQNIGAGMTLSRLTTAVLTKFLTEQGAIDEDAY